jgi:hypothetical protein
MSTEEVEDAWLVRQSCVRLANWLARNLCYIESCGLVLGTRIKLARSLTELIIHHTSTPSSTFINLHQLVSKASRLLFIAFYDAILVHHETIICNH